MSRFETSPEQRPRIDVLEIDDSSGQVVRLILEEMGYRVELIRVGCGQHVVDALGASAAVALVVCAHGCPDGMYLPELAQDLEATQPVSGLLTPLDVSQFARLNGQVVVSTACCTGTGAFADAFVGAGADCYVGSDGYADGSSALLFIATLFYWLSRGTGIHCATRKASGIDAETGLFGIVKANPGPVRDSPAV